MATPPFEPANPSPGLVATGVPLNATLAWSGGDPDPGDAVTYDVYFGTTAPPTLAQSDLPTASYTPTIMSPNTVYFWRIVARDNHGAVTEGPVWEFITGSHYLYLPLIIKH